jgi:hypothetical protein
MPGALVQLRYDEYVRIVAASFVAGSEQAAAKRIRMPIDWSGSGHGFEQLASVLLDSTLHARGVL